MKLLIFFFVLWSWDIQAFAQSSNEPTAFATVSKDYGTLQGKKLELDQMPRVRSQDSVPDCWGFAAATVAQRYICKSQKSTCNPLDREAEISPLSMVAWTHPNSDEGGVAETRNFKNIQFDKTGSAASNALQNARESFRFMPDSCFPHDQLAEKYGRTEESERTVGKIFDVLKSAYNKYKTEGEFCEDCLVKEVAKLKITLSGADIKAALDKDTAGEFLYRLTLGKCDSFIKFRPQPNLDSFPKSEPVTVAQMIEKTKEVLKTGNPLTLDDVCASYSKGKCTGQHSLVISGYRLLCKAGNTQCRHVVKVQNSWGADWQKQHDDGWIDAEQLMATSLKKNRLAWYY